MFLWLPLTHHPRTFIQPSSFDLCIRPFRHRIIKGQTIFLAIISFFQPSELYATVEKHSANFQCQVESDSIIRGDAKWGLG